jgi:hypothetical protein
MSIVNNTQAVPNRVFSVYAAVADTENGVLRDQLAAWATPPSLSTRGGDDDEGGSSALFTNSLNEARRLGLIEEEGDKLRVPDAARGAGGRGADREADFLAYLRATLFDPERAARVGQGGVLTALAWFLTRSPLEPLSFSAEPKEMLRRDLGDSEVRAELGNRSAYQNLLYWARYLGFASIVGEAGTRRAFPDPLRAIAAVIGRVLPDASWLEIDLFLARLAVIYPVLEGGSVRAEVEAMRTAAPSADDRLSVATSLALQRLADRGAITLEAVADAKSRILDFGMSTRRVSRVRLGVAA